MFNTSIRYRKVPLRALLQFKNIDINPNLKLHILRKPCLCGQLYLKEKTNQRFYENIIYYNNVRVHSTHSDQHRQKVVIDTAPIVTDKIKSIEVLPGEKIEEDRLRDYWKTKIDPYVKLARWDKPIGVYLLYWPCTWSIALSSMPGTVPLEASLQTAALFLVGAGLMRGAGCTINDMWDRDIDAQVTRTKDRPLVSGALTQRQALGFLAAQLSLALAILLQLNCFSVMLGASSMLLVVTYPLAKRYTRYPQLVLGATFNWGALLAAAALRGAVDPAAVALYGAAVAWTVLYDTIYAHQDRADDARIGIHSTALSFGQDTRPALAATLAASAGGLAVAGHLAQLEWPFLAAVAAYVAHAARQIYTLDPNNANDCAAKFKSNSFIGAIILLGIMGGGYKRYLENREKNRGKEDLNVTKSCFFG